MVATVVSLPLSKLVLNASVAHRLTHHGGDDWEADDHDGQWICARLKLGRGGPIMFNLAGFTYLFEAGGKF